MPTRVYVVADADGKNERLIRATYRHMAERHVARKMFRSRIASKDDLERLILSGVKPEAAIEIEPPLDDEREA